MQTLWSQMHGCRQHALFMVAGSMQAMMQKMPFGGGGQISDDQLRDGEKKLKRFGSFVELMSAEERTDPSLLLDEVSSDLRPALGVPLEPQPTHPYSCTSSAVATARTSVRDVAPQTAAWSPADICPSVLSVSTRVRARLAAASDQERSEPRAHAEDRRRGRAGP